MRSCFVLVGLIAFPLISWARFQDTTPLVVGKGSTDQFFSNFEAGFVTCIVNGDQIWVISPGGKIVSRRPLGKAQSLQGIDEKNEAVLRPKASGTQSGNWSKYGRLEIREIDHTYRFSGPVNGVIGGGTLGLASLNDTRKVAAIGSSSFSVAVISGKHLGKFEQVTPTFAHKSLSLVGTDLSCAALGHDEICFFVTASSLPGDSRQFLPRIGVRFDVPLSQTIQKCLVVMSVTTGQCSLVTLVDESASLMCGTRGIATDGLAKSGSGRVLLSHDGEVLSVCVGAACRVTERTVGM